jgi:hypothetical protein
MNRKFVIIGFLIGFLFVGYRFWNLNNSINQDQKGYISTFPSINAQALLDKQNDFILFIGNSNCSGIKTFMPELQENIKNFENSNQEIIVVFDEVITKNQEKVLKDLLEEYKIKTNVFLIDNNAYPDKSGYYNSWRRLHSFLKEFDKNFKKEELSYPMYLNFSKGKLVNYSKDLSLLGVK